MIGWLLLAAFGAVVFVVLIRTLRFRPAEFAAAESVPVCVDADKAVADLRDMVRCATVSGSEASQEAFVRFEALLRERFPNIHRACAFEKVGRTGLLYHLPGVSAEKPSVCMAHYDVVPAEEADWVYPPFSGTVADGCIWGRGTLDTKGTLCGVMEALEQLLAEGYVPANDLYLAFSGEEEISGDDCPEMVALLEKRGIKPAFVLDEGGAVVDHAFPGVPGQCAMVGIAEKGLMNVEFSLESRGGHASTPPAHSAVGLLSRAVTRIEARPFRPRLTRPVAEMFDTLGRHSTLLYRMIFANLWCFLPVLNLLCRCRGGELNAMMRTTVAVTRMEGSPAYNVLPPRASFGVNVRLLDGDTASSAVERLKQIADTKGLRVHMVNSAEASPCSDTNCTEWGTLKEVIRQTWPQAAVSPYMMVACTDSRHYCRITDRVYRFSPMHLTHEERAMIHSVNERIPVETLRRAVEFYVRLLRRL